MTERLHPDEIETLHGPAAGISGAKVINGPWPARQLQPVESPASVAILPQITLEELERRSHAYADDMLKELAEFNRQYPVAQGFEAVRDRLGSAPEQQALRTQLYEDFFLYLANEYVLLPPSRHSPETRTPPLEGHILEAYRRYYQECIARWSDERYALDKRFVQLTLLLDQGNDASEPFGRSRSEHFRDLAEVLTNVPAPAVVILGPPGSGKSTLLRHYELECAQVSLATWEGEALSRAPLTFFVSLNNYHPAQPPMAWLAAQWKARCPDLPALEAVLRQRRMTLLLDALNEMPTDGTEPVRQWRAFLQDLVHEYPGNRVVFSCRSLDYSKTLSSQEWPIPQIRLESLSDEQVQDFVRLYSPQYGATLWHNLRGHPQQLALMRSPYYLKLLVTQTVAGEVPVGRAALFTGFVRYALQRAVVGEHALLQAGTLLHERDRQRLIQGQQWRTPFELPEGGVLFPKLSALAFQMQMRWQGQESAQMRIAYAEALQFLDHPGAEGILKIACALGILEQDLGRDEVFFGHQLWQEYFAARHLARAPQAVLAQQEWRAERVLPSLHSTVQELADTDPLPLLPGTGWEETMLMAVAITSKRPELLTELMTYNLALAGRCAVQPDVDLPGPVKDRLRWALVQRTQDPEADLRARIAAGLALGDVGDPRFVRQQGAWGEYLLPPMVDIPGGTYRIGSDDGLYAEEEPVHPVELQPFAIGQFPVTNAEWRLFMQAGGYEEERWWDTDEAQAWRRGEGIAEGAKQQQREVWQYFKANFGEIRRLHQQQRITSQQVEDWESRARMSADEFEGLLDRWYPAGRQTQPAQWHNDAFNNPAQPVVGICWYEARAYCAWLSAQTGQTLRLPTEVEWEAAARGRQGRRYAFGNDFDTRHCNTFETHIRQTTPIGVFPGGKTPEGVLDMTGNVWEWTSSQYKSYPYDAADGRENLGGSSARRAVRGGAWLSVHVRARATSRDDLAPDGRDDYLGVRVVRASPSRS